MMSWLNGVVLCALFGLGDAQDSAVVFNPGDACGHACLYAIARLHGRSVDFSAVKRQLGPGHDGMHSFEELSRAATRLGLYPVAVNVPWEQDFAAMPTPSIVHLNASPVYRVEGRPHYLIVLRVDDDSVHVLDPPLAPQKYSRMFFERFRTGHLLLFAETASVQEQWIREYAGIFDLEWTIPLTIATILCAGFLLRKELNMLWRGMWHSVRVVRDVQKWVDAAHGHGPGGRRLLELGIVVLVFLAGAIAAMVLTRSVKPIAKLEISEGYGDLGSLPVGEHSIKIPIRNSGDAPLWIQRGKSSCNCATIAIPDRIDPGKTADIYVVAHVDPGPRGTRLMLESNAVNSPHFLPITWIGRGGEIAIIPPRVRCVDVRTRSMYERTVQIAYPGGNGMPAPRIVGYECDYKALTIKPSSVHPVAFATSTELNPGKTSLGSLEVLLTVPPPESNSLQTQVSLFVEYDGKQRTLVLPLFVQWIEQCNVVPSKILFSAVDGASLVGQKQFVKVIIDNRVHDESNIEEVLVRDCPTWLNCLVKRSSSNEFDLEMEIASVPDASTATFSILVTQSENEEMCRRLEVRVVMLKQPCGDRG